MFLFSMLSFIKTDNRIMQKLYYRSIAWSIPLSWLFLFTLLIVSIVAIAEKSDPYKAALAAVSQFGAKFTSPVEKFLVLFFMYLGGMFLVQFGAYWMREKIVAFYRWEEQDWWNYQPEEAPGNFPAQLGDFVDY